MITRKQFYPATKGSIAANMAIARLSIIFTFLCLAVNCEAHFLKNELPVNLNKPIEEYFKSFDHDTLLKLLPLTSIKNFNKEICINNDTMEPEAYMTTVEIIQNRGYPAETHTVQTEDGYILELHRIPHGQSGPSAKRPPVFLQHGLESHSGDWIINFGNQSLGFMLADVGFDVWLGNYRGNTYSRKHVTLDPDNDAEQFWNFSWPEHGNYDLPACIDYVLNVTENEQLSYIGHSMGTTGFFVLMSNHTEYNAKIKTMVALAPVAAAAPNSTNGSNIAINAIETILNAIGYYEALPHSDLMMFLASTFCALPEPTICENVIHFIGGFEPDPAQLNSTRLPVYVAHFPAGSSTKNFYHYRQITNNPPFFGAYDYGTIKNNEIYGQDEPPEYDLTSVTAPVALFWGQNDILAKPNDVAYLSEILPNVVLNYRVNYDLWNHMDFLWAIEAESYQNTALVDFLLSRL